MNYNNNKNSTLDNSDSFKKNKQNNSEAFLSYLEKYLIKRELKHFLIYYNQWIEKEKIGKNLFTFVKEINIISKNIKQLNNFYFISYFNDEIFIYDRFFEKKFNYNFDSPISYISEIKYENAEKLFIIISVEDGRLCKIKFENIKININIKYIYINFEFILEIKNNFYILTNNKGTFYYDGLIFDFRKGELKEISEEKLKVGIVLDNRNVLLFNNKNNRGIIYIFNSITKKLNKKNINEFFILSQNCIKLLKLENIKDIKILICGIKKYYQEQKNGFIIFKIKSEDNELIFENFIYDTDNYIINRFLSLKKLNKNNLIFIKKIIKFIILNIFL